MASDGLRNGLTSRPAIAVTVTGTVVQIAWAGVVLHLHLCHPPSADGTSAGLTARRCASRPSWLVDHPGREHVRVCATTAS